MNCKSAPFLMLVILLPLAAAAGSTTVPMQLRGNYPVIIAKIDGIDVPLVFDLPVESALALSQTVIDRVQTSPAGETHRAMDAMGNVIQSGTFKIPRLQIGDAVVTEVIGRPDLHDPAYQSANLGQQGYLGTAFLARLEWDSRNQSYDGLR